MRTEIALLQNVRVASPCSASWNEMKSIQGDRVRFCEGCRKRVYNLSAMGQAEAEGLLRAHEGHLCVRYYRRADGTILTDDCPIGLQAARRLVLTRTRLSAGLCFLLCVAIAQFRIASQTMGGPGPRSRLWADPEPDYGRIASQTMGGSGLTQLPASSPAGTVVVGGLPAVKEPPQETRVTMGYASHGHIGRAELTMGKPVIRH